jgi:nucleoid-associated protein YgaU
VMATWLKILLFISGGIVAAGGTAYVTGALDSWLEPETPIIAALPDRDAAPVPDVEPAVRQDEAAEPADDPALAGEDETERMPAAEDEDIVVPSFDIVRVEPDGSMVIAGHAAPDAVVEVVTGTRVLATAQTGDAGDFAAVLDEPLSPGDYQIVLRATTQDNVVTTSPETAVVSVPEMRDGQVLALVEEPGAPSRLITLPEPVEPAAEIDVTEAEPLAEAEPAGDEAPVELAVSDEIDIPAEAPAEAVEEAPAEIEVTEAPEETAETETAMADEPAQPAEEPAASEEEPAEQDVAALPEAAAEPEATEPVAVESRVFVEAVEIDGDTVFVAGRAEAGRYVRVYANEIVLGETRASEGDRFLVEARVDLPVGDYIIRADLLGSDGSVIARAAVPFEREAGETIAAVAPAAPQPVEEEATEAEAAAEADVAMAAEPVEDEVEPGIAERPAAEPDVSTEEEVAAPAEPADQPVIAETEDTAPETEAELAEAPPADEEIAAAPVEETMSPALERADGAVIIRRGDNLWHISRRVYGHGIRFSTIYLANQDQIRNPDLIWPGQVFNVPAETEQGEMADLEALGEQAVDPSMVPGEIEIYR